MKAQIDSIEPLELVRQRSREVVAQSYEVRGSDDYGTYVNQVPYELGRQLRVGQNFDFQLGEMGME